MAVDLRLDHYRFGLNSGNEATHGWLGALDTAISMRPGVKFLLRIHIQNNGTTADTNLTCTWQYNKNGAGWNNITTTSNVVKAVTPKTWANNADTTNRLGGSGTFETTSSGCTTDGTSGGTAQDIAGSGHAEDEIGLQIVEADVANGDTIQFQVTGTTAITISITPSLTVDKSSYAGVLSFVGNYLNRISGTWRNGVETLTGNIPTISTLKYLANHTVENLSFSGTYSYIKGGVQQFVYTASGVKSFVGTVSRLINNLTRTYASALSFAGGITNKQITKVFSGALSFAGTVAKNIPRVYSGAISFAGTVVKRIAKTYSGALSFAGAVLKAIRKTYNGTLSFSGGILNKAVTKVFAGAVSFAGVLNKRFGRVYDGVASFSGAYEYVKSAQQLFTYTADGVLSIAGTISRLINNLTRTYTGVVTTSGVASRLINNLTRTYLGTLSPSGIASRLINNLTRRYSGVLSTTGIATRLINNLTRSCSGVSNLTGAVSRQINLLTRTVSGTVSMVGTYTYDLIGQIARTVSGELGLAGVVSNDHEEIITITIPAPSLRRRTMQYVPEVFYFKVNPDDGGRFQGEIMVQDGVVPIPVPIVEDPDKMSQKEFEDWRNRTSRRR